MRRILAVTALLTASLAAGHAQAAEGMVVVQSPHSVAQTADNLEAALTEKGMTIMNRIDHAAGAESAGMELAPTQVLIFGNPKAGTPLMKCAQSVAIDLPQKALIWEDENGQTRLGYNDPDYLKSRHNIEGCDQVLENMSKALAAFAEAATR